MGFMTEVSILNDRLHDIRRDPQGFVDAILEAANSGRRKYLGHMGTTILPPHHADDGRAYFFWHNAAIDFTDVRDLSLDELYDRQRLATRALATLASDRSYIERLITQNLMTQKGMTEEEADKAVKVSRKKKRN